MGNTWSDVTNDPAWNDLSQDQRTQVRQNFFNQEVAPNLSDDQHEGVWKSFDRMTGDSLVPKRNVGIMESMYRAAAGSLSGTDQFLRKLGGAAPVAYDAARSAISGTPTTSAQDAYFRNVVDPAVDYGRAQDINPASERQGTAARVAGGLARTGTDIGQMIATGGGAAEARAGAGLSEMLGNTLLHSANSNVLVGGRNAAERGQQVLDAGGTGNQAFNAGLADFGMSTALNSVPLGVASKADSALGRFGVRAATGAPVGVAGAIASNDVANLTSPDSMHRNVTGSDLLEGGLQSALLGGFMGGRSTGDKLPLAHGDDLLSRTATLAPEKQTGGGIPKDQTFVNGYAVLRGSDGSPYAIVPPEGGRAIHLNADDNVNDVIARQTALVPYTGRDMPGDLLSDPTAAQAVTSSARDVTPRKPLALPPPTPIPQLGFDGERVFNPRMAGADEPSSLGRDARTNYTNDDNIPPQLTTDGQPVQAPDRTQIADHIFRNELLEQIGWDQHGGRLLRAPLKDGEGSLGEVTGRTQWVPKVDGDGDSFWGAYKTSENGGGLTATAAREAYQNSLDGKRLGARQQRLVDFAQKWAKDKADAYVTQHESDAADRDAQAQVEQQRARDQQRSDTLNAELHTTAGHDVADDAEARDHFAQHEADELQNASPEQLPIHEDEANGPNTGTEGQDRSARAPADQGGQAAVVGEGQGSVAAPAQGNGQDAFRASAVQGQQAKLGVSTDRFKQLLSQRYGKAASQLLNSGKIALHESADTFPEGAQHLRSDDGTLQAVHDKANGVTHVALDSVHEGNVGGLIMHEVGVHHGLARILGRDRMARLAAQLRVIGMSGKPIEKSMIGESARRAADGHTQDARDEELIAHTVEQAEAQHAADKVELTSNPKATGTLTPRLRMWLSDLISGVKVGMHGIGLLGAHRLNINDMRHLAEGALKRVARDKIPQSRTEEARNEPITSHKDAIERQAGLRQPDAGGAEAVARGVQDEGREGAPADTGADQGGAGVVRPADASASAGPVDAGRFAASQRPDTPSPGYLAGLKRWFGGGVLRDKNGEPQVFHHASDRELKQWNHGHEGANTGSAGSGFGMWLASDHEAAEPYGEHVNSGYARIKNPLVIRDQADFMRMFHSVEDANHFREDLEAQGHDGIVFKDSDQVVVFRPNKDFKSVKNNGDFSEDGNFMASKVPNAKPGEAAAEQIKPEEETETPPSLREQAMTHLRDLAHDLLLKVSPMADNNATHGAREFAKKFANTLRAAQYEYMVADKALRKGFTDEQLDRMWKAADEESVARQQGKPTDGIGLSRLPPEERAAVEHEQSRNREAFKLAVDAGVFDSEDVQLPSYVPRMVISRLASGVAERFGKSDNVYSSSGEGRNVRTSTAQAKLRKYMHTSETQEAAKASDDNAEVVQNFRTLPLATKALMQAAAGRKLINAIKLAGETSGQAFTQVGGTKGQNYFTMADHPAFFENKMRLEDDPERPGKKRAALNEFGDPIYDSNAIYIRKDFEGPLRSVMTDATGKMYNAVLALKSKSMSAIMLSPAIHNFVEFGRAFPAAPGKFLTGQVYSVGKHALADHATMREALDSGLSPITGHGGTNDTVYDVIGLANQPNVAPGRSWTSQVLSVIPNLFDKDAGDAVKRAVDTAGDFMHNKLLWDQIAKLQMGLYVNFRNTAMKDGLTPKAAQVYAAHMANRFAGALPKESMSNGARTIANVVMFSRSFTMGNWGVMKDMLTGLPKDAQAMILGDSGAAGLAKAVGYAKRKAIATVVADIGIMYVMNSLLQSGLAILRGDSTLDKEMAGYARRTQELAQSVEHDPTQAINAMSKISATSDNEPGKEDRVLVGHDKDGTAIYMRNPFGKIGEEFLGWFTHPRDMATRKLSTIARPIYQLAADDRGFGQKLFRPDPQSLGDYAANASRWLQVLVGNQLPVSTIMDAKRALSGDGDATFNALKLALPQAGVTLSRGAPGGEAVGMMYATKDKHSFDLGEQMPAIRDKIKHGDITGAAQAMTKLGVPTNLQAYYVKTTLYPGTRLSGNQLKKFAEYATPEEIERMRSAIAH